MKALSEGKLRNVMAFNITPVEDFDEITFHFLDVVHAKLALEKVSLGKKNCILCNSHLLCNSIFLVCLFNRIITIKWKI